MEFCFHNTSWWHFNIAYTNAFIWINIRLGRIIIIFGFLFLCTYLTEKLVDINLFSDMCVIIPVPITTPFSSFCSNPLLYLQIVIENGFFLMPFLVIWEFSWIKSSLYVNPDHKLPTYFPICSQMSSTVAARINKHTNLHTLTY